MRQLDQFSSIHDSADIDVLSICVGNQHNEISKDAASPQ